MIVSHAHKFIFLKTKKTAGTAIEAALSELCGPSDVITPYREASEQDRKGRAPQNYRIEHPQKPKRPLWRKLLGRPERYYHPSVGFYEHMPACACAPMWARRSGGATSNSPSTATLGTGRSPGISTRPSRSGSGRASSASCESRAPRLCGQLRALHGGRRARGRFRRPLRELGRRPRQSAREIGVKRRIEVPRTNVGRDRDGVRDYRALYTDETKALVAEWYAPEIKLLGYGFHAAGTRRFFAGPSRDPLKTQPLLRISFQGARRPTR